MNCLHLQNEPTLAEIRLFKENKGPCLINIFMKLNENSCLIQFYTHVLISIYFILMPQVIISRFTVLHDSFGSVGLVKSSVIKTNNGYIRNHTLPFYIIG